MTKRIIQVVLTVAIIGLLYFCYESIATPIRFQKEKARRYNQVIERLKDIRKAQLAYNEKYGLYTASFDTLINFVKNDSLPIVMAIGNVPDTLTEEQAVKMNLVTRDTILISVIDTLFGKAYPVDSIKYVPFTNGAIFKMAVGEVQTGSGVAVKVFEAKDSKPFDPSQVMAVGSLTEATTAGNWE